MGSLTRPLEVQRTGLIGERCQIGIDAVNLSNAKRVRHSKRTGHRLTRTSPADQIALTRPLESPIRSMPCTPMRSVMLRNRLLIGWLPSLV